MTEPVPPVPPVDRRGAQRRERDRRASGRALTVVDAPEAQETAETAGRPAGPAARAGEGPAVFAAQMMGQKGQRRGLKGGPVVLDAARTAYLETEYSGARDRRPRAGVVDDSEA